MKTKKSDLLTVMLFCGFLLSMMIGYLFLPKTVFSQREKRYLAEPPKASWEAVSSGEWGNDAEAYLADHIPGRDFFVGLNAYCELYTGRQVSGDIWVDGDRLVEAPVTPDAATVQRNMHAINVFAEKVGGDVDLMIVPSAGWAAGLEGYRDSEIIEDIYAEAGERVHTIDVEPVFRGNPHLYYRTDHHWTSAGAWSACETYLTKAARPFRALEDFTKEVEPGFLGSTYSRSALWLTKGENLELWHGSDSLTVTNGESGEVHRGVFYRERLEEADKYTVYLDGNHSVVRIQNPEQTGKLLVIRDSYSNCLGPFLAESYGEVVLVDLRYYKQPISQLMAQEVFDDVLVCYSIGNFMTDANIILLR